MRPLAAAILAALLLACSDSPASGPEPIAALAPVVAPTPDATASPMPEPELAASPTVEATIDTAPVMDHFSLVLAAMNTYQPDWTTASESTSAEAAAAFRWSREGLIEVLNIDLRYGPVLTEYGEACVEAQSTIRDILWQMAKEAGRSEIVFAVGPSQDLWDELDEIRETADRLLHELGDQLWRCEHQI